VDRVLLEFDERVWDAFFKEFELINTHAEAIVCSLNGEETPKYAVSLDSGIILALNMVARKCRKSSVRRKSIEILKSRLWQEGIVNSMLAARVAEIAVDIEENSIDGEGSCENIPNSARIAGLNISYDQYQRLAHIKYMKCRSVMGGQRAVIKKDLYW